MIIVIVSPGVSAAAARKIVEMPVGGVDIILQLLDGHANSTEVMQLACRVLGQLASVIPSSSVHDVIEHIVEVLKSTLLLPGHADCSGVSRDACVALGLVAKYSPGGYRTALSVGSLDCVVSVIRRNMDCAETTQWACFAYAQILHECLGSGALVAANQHCVMPGSSASSASDADSEVHWYSQADYQSMPPHGRGSAMPVLHLLRDALSCESTAVDPAAELLCNVLLLYVNVAATVTWATAALVGRLWYSRNLETLATPSAPSQAAPSLSKSGSSPNLAV